MYQIFNVENTTIFANIATILGVFVSVVAICLSVSQSKKQFKISQYENRKKLYDYLKNFQDDWLFYIEKIENPFNVALNGFAKQSLETQVQNLDEIILQLTKNYNFFIDQMNEIDIYFKISKKEKLKIEELLKHYKEYYNLILSQASILKSKSCEDQGTSNRMKEILCIISDLLLDKNFDQLLEKMKRDLKII